MPSSRLVLRTILLSAAGAAAAACDPCSGTLGCEEPAIGYAGRIVHGHGEQPVQGAEVTFAPHAAGAGGPQRSVTGPQGIFTIRMDAPSGQAVTGDVTVAAPGRIPYRIEDVRLEPLGRGKLRPMDPWLDELVVLEIVSFNFRGNGQPVGTGTATFRRMGGVQTASEVVGMDLNRHGQTWLTLRPLSSGVVEGRWELRLEGIDSTLVSNVYAYDTEYRPGRYGVSGVGIGPVMAYRGRVVGPEDAPAAAVEVEFVRSGGLALPGDTMRTHSDANGYFIIHPPLVDPLAHGQVQGMLAFRPGGTALAPRTVQVVLSTHEDDDYRDLGVWTLAPQP